MTRTSASLNKLIILMLCALCASTAFAEIPSDGLLDDVTNKFLTQSATWGSVITGYASWIFWVLVTISMVWTFGMMALRKADIGEFLAEFFRFILTTGFFWWLLSNGPNMAISIIDSLREIGAKAAGPSSTILTPSAPISIAFDIVKKALVSTSFIHPIDNLGAVFICLAIVLCMAVVAANVLIAMVTAWVMAYAGVFILGFGGSKWTSDMAIGYFKAMLSIGMELMVMTLLIGIATSVLDSFYTKLNGSSTYELLLVCTVSAVLALLISKIPARVAGLAGGGSGASIGVGSVMGAAAMGAAAVATAGAALAAGAAGAAGGGSAIMAAFQKASAAESAGGGSILSAAGGGGDGPDGGGSGGGGGGTGGDGGSPLAAAMGDSGGGGGSGGGGSSSSGGGSSSAQSADTSTTAAHSGEPKQGGALAAAGAATAKAGRIAAGTASNLAQGTLSVLKEKMSDLKDAAAERIGETMGGKIAEAIKASSNKSESASSDFDNNSLSAAQDKSADAESEVAAFRDRNSKTS